MFPKMYRWTNKRTLLFISYYKKQECLWNKSHPDYGNRNLRDKAYLSLLEQMDESNLTLDIVKIKVRNIRSTYQHELRKIKQSKRSGDPSKVYKPSLFTFEAVHSFLGKPEDGPSVPVEEPQNATVDTSQSQIICTSPPDMNSTSPPDMAATSPPDMAATSPTDMTPNSLPDLTPPSPPDMIPISPMHMIPTSPMHMMPTSPMHMMPSSPMHMIPTSPMHMISTNPMDMPVILLPEPTQSEPTSALNNIKFILLPQHSNNNEQGTVTTPHQQFNNILLNTTPEQANIYQEDAVINQNQPVNNITRANKRVLDANEPVMDQTQPASQPPWCTKKRQIGTNTTEPELTDILGRLEDISKVVNTPREDEDEFHFFGMNIAAQLRRLPLNVALQMQAEFQNALYLARVRVQNTGSSTAAPVVGMAVQSNEIAFATHLPNMNQEENVLQPGIQQNLVNNMQLYERDPSDESGGDY